MEMPLYCKDNSAGLFLASMALHIVHTQSQAVFEHNFLSNCFNRLFVIWHNLTLSVNESYQNMEIRYYANIMEIKFVMEIKYYVNAMYAEK